MDRLLRIRIFDIWVHQQDIRTALGIDAGWDTPEAAVSQEQILRALPYVWARTVGAPEGATVRVEITDAEPPTRRRRRVTRRREGRCRRAALGRDRVVDGNLAGPHAAGLRPGRRRRSGAAHASGAAGDATLGEALLPALSITP